MIRYTIKLAGRVILLVAALFALGLLTAQVADAHYRPGYFENVDRDRDCNPYTYGRPNSCHERPFENVGRAMTTSGVDLLDSDTGYGRAAVFAWSRGYRHVGVVATYSGRSVVRFTIDCNGYRYDDRLSWDDSGPKFRYTQVVPAFGRCDYTAVVRTRGSFIRLGIGAW